MYVAAGSALGIGALAAAAQVPPLRNFLKSRIKPGDGPDAARREKAWFRVDFVGRVARRPMQARARTTVR